MSVRIETCPKCGQSLQPTDKKCPKCRTEVMVRSFTSVAEMPPIMVNKYIAEYKKASAQNPDDKDLNISLGVCFMRLKKYDQALAAFEKAQPDNFDAPEPFFYAAVCRLGGKKPFLHTLPEIKKMEEDIEAANMIDEQPIHHYFLSYIKQDYYKRKFLRTSPTADEELQTAYDMGLSQGDIEAFHAMIGLQP